MSSHIMWNWLMGNSCLGRGLKKDSETESMPVRKSCCDQLTMPAMGMG